MMNVVFDNKRRSVSFVQGPICSRADLFEGRFVRGPRQLCQPSSSSVVVILTCYVCGHPIPSHKYEIH